MEEPPPRAGDSVTPGDGEPPSTPGIDDPAASAPADSPHSRSGGLGFPLSGFTAANDLERCLIEDPVLTEGLRWGTPRPGHPEGSVGAHVADLLGAIDKRGVRGQPRAELRFVALVHDALKGRVNERLPRTGENHHAMRARRFAERYSSDERLLATIELHDRPYSIWKRMRRTGEEQADLLDAMLARLPDPRLFVSFVELDGSTEGKDPGPVRWFRGELAARGRPS